MSFDDELKGGLATQFMRDCMLRDAKDLDNSGAISMEEIRVCAQEKINKRMGNDVNYKPHNLVLNGNANFVPAWFSQISATPVISVSAAPPVAAPAPLTGQQALRQMFDQRDAKRNVQVSVDKPTLRIGKDAMDLTVQSDRDGYVYVALAGFDNTALYMLFPNELDGNNKIQAGQKLVLPRPSWRVTAGGPVGTDHLIVMVSDAPRDLSALAENKAGPFVSSLNDPQGPARLGALMTSARLADTTQCQNAATRSNNPACSDAYGAAMVSVEEVK